MIRRGMLGSLIGVALALLLLLPAATDAGELLDVLRKKGVISQKEYDELKAVESKREAKVKEELEKRAEATSRSGTNRAGGSGLLPRTNSTSCASGFSFSGVDPFQWTVYGCRPQP